MLNSLAPSFLRHESEAISSHSLVTSPPTPPEMANSSQIAMLPDAGSAVPRTGSPTPSEAQELKQLDSIFKRIFRKETWKDRKTRNTILVVVTVVIAITLVSLLQDKIIKSLRPFISWVRATPPAVIILVLLMLILSIPPLVGAELIQLLCGIIYGVGLGFAIICIGVIIGQLLVYYSYRYFFRSRAEKIEKGGEGSIRWPALGRVIREGGFLVALVVRYTLVPPHIAAALFAVCGVNFWTFFGTMILSLPREFLTLYLAMLPGQSNSHVAKYISIPVFGVYILISVFAVRWISKRERVAALAIIRERREVANRNAHLGVASGEPV